MVFSICFCNFLHLFILLKLNCYSLAQKLEKMVYAMLAYYASQISFKAC